MVKVSEGSWSPPVASFWVRCLVEEGVEPNPGPAEDGDDDLPLVDLLPSPPVGDRRRGGPVTLPAKTNQNKSFIIIITIIIIVITVIIIEAVAVVGSR